MRRTAERTRQQGRLMAELFEAAGAVPQERTAMAARQLIPAVAGRSPLSAAGTAHAEAQYLAKRMALVAVNDGWNVILDVPLVSRPSAESWIYALRFADYAVTAVLAGTAGRKPSPGPQRTPSAARRRTGAGTGTAGGPSQPGPSGRWTGPRPRRPGTASVGPPVPSRRA
jgi:hypothetical protein